MSISTKQLYEIIFQDHKAWHKVCIPRAVFLHLGVAIHPLEPFTITVCQCFSMLGNVRDHIPKCWADLDMFWCARACEEKSLLFLASFSFCFDIAEFVESKSSFLSNVVHWGKEECNVLYLVVPNELSENVQNNIFSKHFKRFHDSCCSIPIATAFISQAFFSAALVF